MTIFLSLLLLGLFKVTSGVPSLQINDEPWGSERSEIAQETLSYRLPLTVNPITYKLTLMPILTDLEGYEKLTAPGQVIITMEATMAINVVCLHQNNLSIDKRSVKVWRLDENGGRLEEIPVIAQTQDSIKDFYYIQLSSLMVVGAKYELTIQFVTPISTTELSGLYLSSYTEPVSGEIKYLATTQFQPTDARKAFPCFDEPALKATFEITLGRHKSFSSLSNMEIYETTPMQGVPDWEWDSYRPTVKMSTYLIAMIVSDFESEEADSSLFDKPVKVFGPPHLIQQNGGVFAAEASARIINFFQTTFSFTYPLTKLYSVGIPQFSAGAMENWGLNTYRTEYLLHIPNENTEAERKKITQVLSHEIVHQWLGDLVTCAWWSDIYLNEGFARFLQYRGMTLATPEFKTDIAIISDATRLAFTYDQGQGSHPIKDLVESPTDANNIFSSITYDKAASVLRMIETVLTRPLFDTCIRRYLETFKYSNVVQDDLFEHFQLNGGPVLPNGVTFKQILDTWTLQAGYPLVRVSRGGANQIYLSQERFQLNSGPNVKTLRSKSTWYIPIKIVTQQNPDFTIKTPDMWLLANTTLLPYSGVNANEWIIANPDLTGYYRVLYDVQLKKLIKNQLELDHSIISPGTRSQILEDYFNFAYAKYVPYSAALELTKYLRHESELVVWMSVLANLRNIFTRFSQDSQAFKAFNDYFTPIFEGTLDSTGWEQVPNEKGAGVILRAQLLDYACALANSKCTAYSQNLWGDWVKNPSNRAIIPPDIRPIVFCAAIANGNDLIWGQAYDLYKVENYTAKSQLYKALACSQDEQILSEFMKLALDGQDDLEILTVLQNIAGNSMARHLVFEFTTQNYSPTGPIGPTQFGGVVATLSTYWNSQTYIDQIQQFMDANQDTLTPVMTSLENSLGKIRSNIDWWRDDGKEIVNWLQLN